MPNILIKGLNKILSFPSSSSADDIGGAIKKQWPQIEEMAGLPMDKASIRERAGHLGFQVAGLGGLAMLAPEDVEASFLGQGAKKAALDMLGMAKKMEGSKVDVDEIWQKTGWGKGADDKWRFEVSDDMAQLNVPDKASGRQLQDANDIRNFIDDAPADELAFEMELMDFKGTPAEYKALELKRAEAMLADTSKSDYPLETVLDHPDLLDTDPTLKGVNTQFRDSWQSNKGAAYTPKEDSIRIGTEEIDKGSAMLHETQHAIQAREGFAMGGSPEAAKYASQDHFIRKKTPLYKGQTSARSALNDMGRYGKADYIARLDKLSKSDKVTPSSVLNLSDFYGYSDEIRNKFGSMPKTNAKGRNGWLQSAAAFIKNKNLADIDYYDLQLVKDAIEDPKQNKAMYSKAKRLFDKNSEDFKAYRAIEGEQNKFDNLTPYEQYERLAGEVEARNVQTRLDMSPEQRRLTPPWKTEDVPRGEQIVKYGLGGGGAALASISPVQAAAHKNFMAELSGANLPSATAINAPFIDQSKIPSHLRPDLGGIESPSSPTIINQAGAKLKNLEVPVLGNPLEGVADYLENFGYQDTAEERAKRAALAGLDLI